MAVRTNPRNVIRKKPTIRKHIFRGKAYNIKWRPVRKLDGSCDHPAVTDKEMLFRTTLGEDPRNELETYIHECLHACYFDQSEEAVYEAARDIAYFLWRLKYRKAP